MTGMPSFIVPNGLDTAEFRSEGPASTIRHEFGIPLDAPLVIAVGRPDPSKRLDLLISALSEVEQVYLAVVGPENSPLSDEYKARSRALGVDARVIWTGYKTGKELIEIYSAADVAALLSESENFGMVVVEALAVECLC